MIETPFPTRNRLPGRVVCALAVLFLGASFMGCGPSDDRTRVTIYTSIYESVIVELGPVLEAEFPDIVVAWYQKGSEEVAAKVNSEIAAGEIRADLIMTSDPFWYEELKAGGHLLAYTPEQPFDMAPALRDPGGAFVTVRVPVMVLTVNVETVAQDDWPSGFDSLTDPKWAGRITMGDPLQSGSNFTAVGALSTKYGWEYFEALRRNDLLAAGGNSSVLNRVRTGEKDVGIILLENLLREKEMNPTSPAAIIYPADGVILVPSPIAIIATTKVPEASRRIYDFMLSEAGQNAIIAGYMYSPMRGMPAPAGARSWEEVYGGALVAWTPEHLQDMIERRDEIKRTFSRLIFE